MPINSNTLSSFQCSLISSHNQRMNLLNTLHTLSPPFPTLQFHTTRTVTIPCSRRRLNHSSHVTLLPRRRYPKFKVVVRSSLIPDDDRRFLDGEEAELLLATCITRYLPPALTLEQGLDKIKDAVEVLKSNPPRSTCGMYRFQVAVSPGAKAISWFCRQAASSGVFPQFFVSTEVESPTSKSLSSSGTRGVFGIGAAVYFKGPYMCASAEEISSKRYSSVNSTLLAAYGALDSNFLGTASSMKYESSSFCTFIPQIELVELEGLSLLAGTLVWSNSFLCAFDEAVQIHELSLNQAKRSLWPMTEEHANICISAALRNFNIVEDKNSQMVFIKALSLGGRDGLLEPMELKNASSSYQFSLRLSATVAVSNSMLNHIGEISCPLREYSNINTLWASLIVEECYRLGLTYFCIAPGSRSSPLAVAASSHPLTSCIACVDERSLAFHAVGYARGSNRPAVVITSSGTAVSNLLPAVVEAYQDFLPLVLLTADRPPELQDAGANQSINQVNHFGSFVRHSFVLPAPTDTIPARMVLTTIDSAVYYATSSACGPVHINCPFRDPLDGSTKKWALSCLKGLDFWVSSSKPFTNYIQAQHSFACGDTHGHLADVLQIIQGAKRGLLLLGGIHTEDDIWAALLLAKHLCWPVVADILSGLRLRKYGTSFSDIEENILFVDHLDHCLLSGEVRHWVQADVVLQIGSRITSKSISQMLEDCFPCSYILVDNHPSRHDPSHIVTHRIQSTVTQFTDFMLRSCIPHTYSKWSSFLRALNSMVTWEISFLINSECSLTEPFVAGLTPEALDCGSAIFIGNSMPIRDADMYGGSLAGYAHISDMLVTSRIPCHWIHVAGNRGASGIDGLTSTAVGFAAGCNRRVLCVIGDVSFLHDTNGLALLKQRILRKQMTILVINNHGGAIFSLLPIANRTEQRLLDQYFYTSHNVGVQNLCLAHGLKHVQVQTKRELQDALFASQREEVDCVIEVESCINTNASFHSTLRKFACQAADYAFTTLSRLTVSESFLHGFMFLKVREMKFSQYRVQLCAPLTSAPVNYDPTSYYREGFVLSLSLEDGSIGYGEVAPMEIHKESLLDVEDQLRFLVHVMKGTNISVSLPLLKGSFSSWIWTNLGISPGSIFPSVRCGLEMAVLCAIAAAEGSSLLNVLLPQTQKEEVTGRSSNVQICALIDSNGTPEDVAYFASTLVEEGFTAIKLKVARRADPLEDAAVIQEIRKKVGNHIKLRADANRKWAYKDAIQFGSYVKDCGLQYIEEPVRNEDNIIKFCEESGLPVALDETIDSIQENPLQMLARFNHKGVVAVVIKPSVVGGFENAALIARWAQQQGKMTVVSAAFESGLGLSAYIQFSRYLDLQNADICKLMNKESASPVAHGLGTYRWFKEDVITESLCIHRNECSGIMEAYVLDAGQLLRNLRINQKSVIWNFTGDGVRNYQLRIHLEDLSLSFNVQEIGQETSNNVLVFLHGFLGTGEDWIPIMKAMSGSARCIAIDLPGHGGSKMRNKAGDDPTQEPANLSINVVADVLRKLFLQLTPGKVTIVGYSMGARITLYMALRCCDMVEGIIVISGSPGLHDEVKRKVRRLKDDSRACALVAQGLDIFLETWYDEELWKSLRVHPHFKRIVAGRLKHKDVHALAKILSDLSIGRQPSLWEDLKHCKSPVLIIIGERDEKFKRIAHAMYSEISQGTTERDISLKCHSELVEISNCGHAVHLENPLLVINAIRRFLTRMKDSGHYYC